MTWRTRLLLPLALAALAGCSRKVPGPPADGPPADGPPAAVPVGPAGAVSPAVPRVAPADAPPAEVAVGDRKLLVRDCLLRLPQARRVRTTALAGDQPRLAALTDDDARTAAVLPATRALPLDVVYEFGGADVAAHELVVLLPEAAPADARAARVEVLTSAVSADAGFQLLRADPLEATDRVQRFRLRPQAARWVMVRFLPGPAADRVAVAEVALLGRVGPPDSAYAFKESPAKALDVLEKLKGLAGVAAALGPDEAALTADVKDGKLQTWDLADAALVVSGVADPARRTAYRARIDALAAAAAAPLAGADTPEAKGTRLLGWLHERAFAGGYAAGQTDLPPVLDGGTFNCVSSAVLYTILARRLGLDARGVQVPDHAFGVVYAGTRHFDVETTTPRGFDPARDPAAVAEFAARTGFAYIPDSDRDRRREVTDAGLLAMVWYNHGCRLAADGDHRAALAAYFRALGLDRELAAAAKNALVSLAAWALAEGAAGRFDTGRAVARAGLDLAPNDPRVRYAHARVWADSAEAEAGRNGLDAGLAVLRQAAGEVPDGPFVQLQAWLAVRPADALAAAGKWEEAVARVDPALPKVDPPAREEVLRWRGGLFLRWANAELAAGRFEQALTVVERGLRLHPADGRFPDLLTAVARSWVQTAQKEKGPAEGKRVVAALAEKAKSVPALKEAVRRAPYWLVIELRGTGTEDEAEAAMPRVQPPAAGEVDEKQVLRTVYDHWAGARLDAGDFRGAFGVYVKGLNRLPDDPVLLAHLTYVLQRWFAAVEKRDGEGAMKDLVAALRTDHPALKEYIGLTPATAWAAVRTLRDAGQFAEAVDVLDRYAGLLTEKAEVQNMYRHLYDRWADVHLEKKEFAAAADVYTRAAERFPTDSHVENNLAVTAQDWALALHAAGKEGEAKDVMRRMVARFPEVWKIGDVARNHVRLIVQARRRAKSYPEALAALDGHRDLLRDLHGTEAGAEERRIGRQVYAAWADEFLEREKWEEAVGVYEKGMARFPAEGDLRAGAERIYDDRADALMKAGDWDGAIAVYDAAVKRLGPSSHLKTNREYCVAKRDKKE